MKLDKIKICLGLFIIVFSISYVKSGVTNEDLSHGTTLILIKNSFQQCLNNKVCMRVFEQNDYVNITIFEYLFKAFLEKGFENFKSVCRGSMVDQSICSRLIEFEDDENYSVEENLNKPILFKNKLLKELFIRELIIWRSQIQVCDINHKLVIDKNGLKSECVCKYEGLCENSKSEKTTIIVISILILILIIISTILVAYKIYILKNEIKNFYKEYYYPLKKKYNEKPTYEQRMTIRCLFVEKMLMLIIEAN
jgi:hypothetical protein